MKLPLYYINQKYVNNFENIIKLLNYACFLHPMNMLGFDVICVSLIESIRGWMNCCHRSFTRKKKESKEGDKNGRQKKIDLVYGKCTNVCKLGAKWNGQGFNNHKSQSQQFLIFNYKNLGESTLWWPSLGCHIVLLSKCVHVWMYPTSNF